MPNTLSILVIAFQEVNALPLQAAALDHLVLPDGWQVERILVDGGSTDGTPERAEQLGYRVVVMPGASIPVCRNRALAEASGNVLAFLDADCAPVPTWFSEAWPFLEGDAPVMLGWPVLPPDPGTRVQRAWHAHWSHKNAALETWRDRQVVRHEAFRLMATRNMLMNREVAEQLGGFDEELPTGEDTDFALRAFHAGITVLAVDTLLVRHYGEPATLRAFFRQQLWHANRASYRKILRTSGGRSGGNAPLFTLLFLGGTALAVLGLLLGILIHPGFLLLLGPLPTLLAALSLRTARKARQLSLWPDLALLYAAYGLARSLDLLGFGRTKHSWKAPPKK